MSVVPAIQKMATFAYLNLVDDVYPSPLTNTMAMDVIFCRNVLMYMAPEQAKRVIHKLSQALTDGGWLIVSPSEVSHTLFCLIPNGHDPRGDSVPESHPEPTSC